MKRTPLKRTPLAPGVKQMRRSAVKRVGKRRERDREERIAFGTRTGHEWCELCFRETGVKNELWIEAHHRCPKGRAGEHKLVNSPLNRMWVCRVHHEAIHMGLFPDHLRSRDFLDSLTETQE